MEGYACVNRQSWVFQWLIFRPRAVKAFPTCGSMQQGTSHISLTGYWLRRRRPIAMTGFDIVVLLVVGLGAATGFLRGFVQEVLALSAWVIALAAIHYFHSPLTEHLLPFTGDRMGASAVLAFALLMLIPYAIIKMLANRMGELSRDSLIGPIDRVIGFGFGALKGFLITVLAFSLLVLGYDTVWGIDGRPNWITQARSYPFINAASESLVKMIAERRTAAADAEHRRLEDK